MFAGSIPAIYDRHLGPLLFEDFANDIAELLAPAGGLGVLVVRYPAIYAVIQMAGAAYLIWLGDLA